MVTLPGSGQGSFAHGRPARRTGIGILDLIVPHGSI
jgi:hypothetical protein